MSFRTDKLVLLLDTGTSTQVRRTAAKQLADITLKTFRSAPPDESKDDTKPGPSISAAKEEEKDVKPTIPNEENGAFTIEGRVGEDDAWAEVLDTIARLLPLLKSRSSETRSAASNALGLLASTLPPYTSSAPSQVQDTLDSERIDVHSLLSSGQTLLASAGREYVAKPMTGTDKAKRRKAMMGSLGLGDVGWGDDVDQVLGDDDEESADIKPKTEEASSGQKEAAPSTPQDIFEGLSARQITMLKRKKGDMVAEANKMRKLNAQANGSGSAVTPTSATPTPAGSPKPNQPEVVTIDPGAKARAAAASGGAFEPTLDAAGNVIAPTNKTKLSLSPGISPWTVVLLEVVPDIGDQAWQTRHGTSLALLELLRSSNVSHSAPTPFLVSIARQLLTLLVLDRFGDFVGDTVMAPVRETAGQALGVLLKFLPDDAIYEVHAALLEMVRQPWAKRGKPVDGGERKESEKFRWEVRHAGLLGIKYEVAVRGDLLTSGAKHENGLEDVKPAVGGLLHDVVDAAILALRDIDDDVRTVAASALLPITDTLSTALAHDELCSLVDTLWDCLAEGGDDLGSSTGAVMDLLGAMITHSSVMAVMGEMDATGQPRQAKITRIFAFIRHPIATVRLAVARVLQTFTTAPALSSSAWQSPTLSALLFQNLVLEERPDIRSVSCTALISALEATKLNGLDDLREAVEDSLSDWYQIVMTPPGAKIDTSLLTRVAKASSSHNVDKAMLEGDLSLVNVEIVMETRLVGVKALAKLRQYGAFEDSKLIKTYLASPSAHQVYMASAIITEWSQLIDEADPSASERALGSTDQVAKDLSSTLLGFLERPLPPTYSEMTALLKKVYSECHALLGSFSLEGKVSKDRIPTLPSKIDPLGNSSDTFTLATAQLTVTKHFDALTSLLSKNATKNVLPSLKDRRNRVMVSIGRYGVMKERYDTQVMAGIAGALVSLRVLPPKIGQVVKAIMDSIKKEENPVLQSRSADSIASLIHLCGSPISAGRPNPSDKIVRNLFTFLCQDTSINPIFTLSTEGIVSLKDDKPKKATKAGVEDEETEEQISMRVMRQGASMAFERLAGMFGQDLLEKVPKYWEGISQPLIGVLDGAEIADDADERLKTNIPAGQDIIDALTTIRLTAPHLDPAVQTRIMTLFPQIIAALQSSYSLLRVSAAKCIASLCMVMTEDGMKSVVDNVVPLIGDAKRVPSRQGAVEAVHHIIKSLDIKALPYVLFLIVPILGRMSDPDESVRLLSTSTFASLVKMVPLEAGIPDPPGFSPELLAKRDEERKFLMQLLDGSKAEQYQIPIEIKADLRQYQKDGVSWLAFLAKYQLHGILCDDMGLGKSLQSICIVGSKHHERAQRHKQTGSVDSAHLPSLFVCPPTLCGHWYHEILKFTDYLRPIQYTGSTAQRASIRSQLTSSNVDVVITSYETVRADIEYLSNINWLYCVLDEGHIIKNAKTKLSAAVKLIRAQHRLLLSGTPIQNNVLELWSLFDFLMPGFLGTERVFNDRFSKPILADRDGKASPKERELATAALESLHKQVLPFLLRRLKEDVLSDLPPKIIQDYHCELSDVQKQLYDEYSKSQAATEAGQEVQSEAGAGKQQHVFQSLQYLRKLCNHPALVLQGEEQRTKDLLAKLGSKAGIHDISHAPKLEALKQLLTDCGIGQTPSDSKIKDEMEMPQHRVLIFCQLRPMLDLIERDLFAALMPSVTYMRMDGSTDPSRRHAVVQTFNQDPRIDVLLLTTSVGGLGLNLTGADTVIFVDHDWNPMKDLQAMDRAHRLGQKKVVNVYRLITRGTLEEKIMGLQRFKLNIASSVITQQNSGLGSMNTGEVLDLFTVSAEGESQKKKDSNGPVSASKVLEGLEDLQPEDEYADLSLSNFMSKV